jgi:hypothetical protein
LRLRFGWGYGCFSVSVQVLEELSDYGEFLFFFDDFGAGRESAEFGVDDELFYQRGLGGVFFVAAEFAIALRRLRLVAGLGGVARGRLMLAIWRP